MSAPTPVTDGAKLSVTFDRFDLASYGLFIRTKRLPESQVTYDWESDAYTLTTAARFAPMLGVQIPAIAGTGDELAGHLFDYQHWAVGLALESKRFALWCDCVAGETVIDTPDGSFRIDELATVGRPIRVWALDGDQPVAAIASAPFRKGRADLFDVTLSDGSVITTTTGHRLLTPQGWRLVGDLQTGDQVIGSDPIASPEGVQHWTRIPAGSTDSCSTGSRRCGPRPRSAGGSDRAAAPSPADAPAPVRPVSRTDAPGHESAHSRGRRSSDRPATLGSIPQGCCAAGDARSRVASSRDEPPAWSSRVQPRSGPFASPAPSTLGSDPRGYPGELVAASSCRCGYPVGVDRYRGVAWPDGPASPSIQGHERSPRLIDPPLSPAGSPRSDRPTMMPSVPSIRNVVSVNYNRTDEYYDLHVPGYENYWAEGIWNHNTGLGKMAMGIEWGRQVHLRTGARVLAIMPLSIIQPYRAEATRFYGDDLPMVFLDTAEAVARWCEHGSDDDGPWFGVTNYEKFARTTMPELRYLGGLIADESSILKTGGGAIKWNLIKSARGIEYKLSCTATPAPNDAMEYASQAAFLETIRNEGEILWTYFSRDKRGEWSVKAHAREAFYRFMASWSLYLRNPATFGFGDILSTLPAPVMTEERIAMTGEQRVLRERILAEAGAGLLGDDRLGMVARTKLAQIARGFMYDGRDSSRTTALIDSHKPSQVAGWVRDQVFAGRPSLVWTAFDEEGVIVRRELDAMLPAHHIGILTGSQKPEQRQELLDRFRDGQLDVLISKPSLIGYGLNLQHVRAMVFSGVDDSMERRYQAIRRAYRFGQTHPVHVHTPYIPELEGVMFDNVAQKEARFLEDVTQQERHYRSALMGGSL